MTVSDVTTRILNELDRDDLTAEVSESIVDAVKWYQDERFWFNEGQYTFSTVTSSEAYSMSTVLEIDSVVIYVNGHPYPLNPRPYQYIDERRDPSYTGYPTDYAIFNDSMYLHPIPNQTLTVVVSGCLAPATLSITSDTNVFLDNAEELIRLHAKADIYANILGEMDQAQVMAALEQQAYDRLSKKTTAKIKSGYVTPTEF